MKLIINADDFGAGPQSNAGIALAFEKGLITNTTYMVNMTGSEEALLYCAPFRDRVGLHLNFVHGTPLSPELAADPIFSGVKNSADRKQFTSKLGLWGRFFLPRSTRKALQAEAELQIKRYLECGFTQMHADSHCHVLHIYSVYKVVAPILKKYGFRTIRIPMCAPGDKKLSLTALYNRFLRRQMKKDFKTVDYFSGSFSELSKAPGEQVCELMVHLCLRNGHLMEKKDSSLPHIPPNTDTVTMISYSDI